MIWVLELEDTLLDTTGSERRARSRMCAGLAGHSGLPPARVVTAYREADDRQRAAWDAGRRWATGTMRAFRTAVYTDLLRELGLDPARAPALAEAHEKVRFQGLELFPDARPCLERLRAAGHRLILAAAGPPQTRRAECAATGILGYFHRLFLAGELGAWAPEVWLNRDGGPLPAGAPAPPRVIRSLDEL